jgi:uncharacterized protein YjbI with pentapeptide repeats
MGIDRRNLLLAAAAAATTSQYAHGKVEKKRVTQRELDQAIWLHGMWLTDMNIGQRCVFAGRDLSGLHFGALGPDPIDLSGADFAQADLSRTEADALLVHHCNFNGTKFDGCHWRRPVFEYADMRRVSASGVKWGAPGHRGSPERSPADLSHVVLFDANLSKSRICGFFYGTKLRDASLEQADLSHSDLWGPKYYEMSFSGANLNGAILRHCDISSASFFNADCSDVDFSHTVFADVRMKGCNLSGARFRDAEIEQTIFSPDQMRTADFRGANGNRPITTGSI